MPPPLDQGRHGTGRLDHRRRHAGRCSITHRPDGLGTEHRLIGEHHARSTLVEPVSKVADLRPGRQGKLLDPLGELRRQDTWRPGIAARRSDLLNRSRQLDPRHCEGEITPGRHDIVRRRADRGEHLKASRGLDLRHHGEACQLPDLIDHGGAIHEGHCHGVQGARVANRIKRDPEGRPFSSTCALGIPRVRATLRARSTYSPGVP
jgi:hypothetical protein